MGHFRTLSQAPVFKNLMETILLQLEKENILDIIDKFIQIK